MSEIFTASNGWELRENGAIYSSSKSKEPLIGAKSARGLGELFQRKRDRELGRWRWPENADYVVYPNGTSRTVINESNGHVMIISLHDRKVMNTYLDSYVGAAKAYDTAHPEPKPAWHDAKPGEAWFVELNGFPSGIAVVRENFTQHLFMFDNDEIFTTADHIVAARRIYPEGD